MHSTPLSEYFVFAHRTQFLRTLSRAKPDDLCDNINSFVEDLEFHGFRISLAVAQEVVQLGEFIQGECVRSRTIYAGGVPTDHLKRLRTLMTTVYDGIQREAAERHMIVLNRSLDLDKICDLHETLDLNEDQQLLRDDVVRCMECEAYRSAMVMGWNLAYDYIRRYIFDDDGRRGEFNAVLTTKNRRPNTPYEELTEYKDFFALSERNVLDWAQEARLYGDRVRRALVEKLDRRNDYAHANFKKPDNTRSMAYILELMNLISDTPFN